VGGATLVGDLYVESIHPPARRCQGERSFDSRKVTAATRNLISAWRVNLLHLYAQHKRRGGHVRVKGTEPIAPNVRIYKAYRRGYRRCNPKE